MRAKLEFENERHPTSLVCMEPAQIPIQGIFPARSLTRVGSNDPESPRVTQRAYRAETQCPNASAYVLLANFSEETLTIPNATILGIAEEVPEQLIDKINSISQTDSQTPRRPPRQKKNESLYHKLLQCNLTTPPPSPLQMKLARKRLSLKPK